MRKLSVPTNAAPATPGEIIIEEYLKPMGLTQQQLADALGIDRVRLNMILNGRRSVTADTAMRLERVLGPSAQSWLNMQTLVDLYAAAHSDEAKAIKRLKPLNSATHPRESVAS